MNTRLTDTVVPSLSTRHLFPQQTENTTLPYYYRLKLLCEFTDSALQYNSIYLEQCLWPPNYWSSILPFFWGGALFRLRSSMNPVALLNSSVFSTRVIW